jgi:alpha-glucosidase
VYQLYVRSFADANGDGVGIAGIRSHLRYIADLGGDPIFLKHSYPSPQHDHGYDVANFFDIEPTYGDLATFDAMLAETDALGLRVMMDIVPNHCSWDHPWFRDAAGAGPNSPARERFWFRDGSGPDGDEPPNNWTSHFTGPAWSRVIGADGRPEQWYMHTFAAQQPDWNWNHPDVIEHYDQALRFWLDRGVAGFRVDAPAPVGKAPGLPDAPVATADAGAAVSNPYREYRPEGHEVWRHWRRVLDDYEREHEGRDVVMVAETYSDKRPDIVAAFVGPDQHHQAFAFELMVAPWKGDAVRRAIDSVLHARDGNHVSLAWTLNNHDAQRAVTRLGRADAASDGTWGLRSCERHRRPSIWLSARAERAVMLMLLLPGSCYLYQGEELGLPEVLDLPAASRQDPVFLRSNGSLLGRDGCRVPLPWTTDEATSFGFSPTDHAAPWQPQPSDWGRYAAAPQADDDASMLALYMRALRSRREQELARGEFAWLGHDDLVAYRRGATIVIRRRSSTSGSPSSSPW